MAILNSFLDLKKQILEIDDTPVVFIERSPLSALVFARIGYKRGYFTSNEMKLFEELVEKFGWCPDFVMILNTPVNECFKRMRLRNRVCESSVDISYLQDLADEYQQIKKTHTLNYYNSPADIANNIMALLN